MTLLPKAGMYPYTRECTRYAGWTRRQDGEAVVDGREVWLSLSFEKKFKTGTGVHNEGGGCGHHTKRAEGSRTRNNDKKNTCGAIDAGEDGWERLGAGLAEGGGAKEADKRERTIISHR